MRDRLAVDSVSIYDLCESCVTYFGPLTVLYRSRTRSRDARREERNLSAKNDLMQMLESSRLSFVDTLEQITALRYRKRS